jgi:thioredoxin 1
MPDAIEMLTDEAFGEKVLKSPVPYLIEYMSPWCASCAALQPVLEEIAAEMRDTVKVGKVDIFACPSLSESQGVMSTPTMIVFVDGQPVKRILGAKPKRHIVAELRRVLEGSGPA